MNQKLFEKRFLDVEQWVKKSREQMISAHYLVAIWAKLYATGNEIPNLCIGGLERHPFEAWVGVGNSAALTIGLALENALKGHLIARGEVYIGENGKIFGLDSSHNILSMVEKSSYNADEPEAESLKMLTFQVQSLSKYHLAKSVAKQSEFTGRVGNPIAYYKLADKIIKSLFESDLRDLYLHSDGSYAHIPKLPEFSVIPTKELLRQIKADKQINQS